MSDTSTIPAAVTVTVTDPLSGVSARSPVYRRGLMDRAGAKGKPGDPIRFVAATEGFKGDGLNLLMSGVDLERFEGNPVFLWAHDYRSPAIGRVVATEIDGARLLEDVVFDQADEFAVRVEQKYRDGFMSAVSVGFDPVTVVDANSGKSVSWWQGGNVTEWSQLELSAVPVPMDPDALVDSGRAALRSLATDVLAVIDPPIRAGAVLSARNRDKLEQARNLVDEVLASADKDDSGEDDGRAVAFLTALRDSLR